MNETMNLVLAGFAGLLLGAFFFGGLWWTVQVGISAKYPAVWFLLSSCIRIAVVLSGFYFVADGRWQRMLTCLSGFILGRLIVSSLTRPTTLTRPVFAKETDHAAHS